MICLQELNHQIAKSGLADPLKQVCELIHQAGGSAWLVGGSVRDGLMGRPIRDLDLEVFSLPADQLCSLLQEHFPLDLVGQSFGIIKLRGLPIDIGIPRREAKRGLGHRGFEIDSDPNLPLPEAAARRDFTVNAIYYDILNDKLEDPFLGQRDLKDGILRHTSAAFSEDPLRVLRGMQLAGRFDFKVAPKTIQLCRGITTEGLPHERIFAEWKKLITLGGKPSRGLTFLRESTWLRYYPELAALPGCQQDPRWHPEGDVWQHTLHSMDAFAADLTGDAWEDLVVGLAVLCHDFGKVICTIQGEDRIRTKGHDQAGVPLTESFIERLTNQPKLVAEVLPLVREHMRPVSLYGANASDAAIRRLAARVKRIDRLERVARADNFGRPPLPAEKFLAGDWLLEKAEYLQVIKSPPAPIILGRHLMTLELEPGGHFAKILDKCFEAQLSGEFLTEEEGLVFARRITKKYRKDI